MSEVRITAEPRTEFGKGAARRIRRADKVPAVLYGHGTDPLHITLPGHDADARAQARRRTPCSRSTSTARTQLALPKEVQRDPIKGFLEHVDLVVVRRGEKVTVEIPIHLVGEAGPGHPGRHRDLNALSGRGRGHPHPRVRRGLHRGPAGRHPDPRQGPRAARRHDAGHRRGGAGRQRRPRRRPPRRSRPSWPRPRPRSASSTRPPTRSAEQAEAGGRGRRRRRRRRRRGRAGRQLSLLRRGVTPRRRGADRTSVWLVVGLGNPGPGVRRQPAQRRLPGRRRAGRADGRPVQGAQGRAPTSSRAGSAGSPGRAGQAAHLHERVRRPGRRAARLLQGPARAARRRPRRAGPAVRRAAAQARRRRQRPQRPAVDARARWAPASSTGCGSASAGRPAGWTRPTSCCATSPRPSARSSTVQVDRAADAVEALVTDGLERTQNTFNT